MLQSKRINSKFLCPVFGSVFTKGISSLDCKGWRYSGNHFDTAGSGGGWREDLSMEMPDAYVIPLEHGNVSINGGSINLSFIGGINCGGSATFGGFGGGGGGCFGGGGGGGFIGGNGGATIDGDGEGGWSFYNQEAVIRVLSLSHPETSSSFSETGAKVSLPQLEWHRGQGTVNILPPVMDAQCTSNCSTKGAACIALDLAAKVLRCVCDNGMILDHINSTCESGTP